MEVLDWAMLGTGPLAVSGSPGLGDVGDRPSLSELGSLLDWAMLGTGPLSVSWALSWTGRCWGQALSQ